MNILYLHQYFSTPKGSTGLRTYEFAKALVGRGHSVHVLCARDDGSNTGLEKLPFYRGKRTGDVDGIKVTELQIQYSNLLSFYHRVSVFLKYAFRSILAACNKDYDVVFATSTPLTAAIPGITAAILVRKKFVFEVRDLWPELPKAMGVITNPLVVGMMEILEWAAYKSAVRIIGLSPGIVEGIVKHNISKDQVKMIPNACDDQLFNPQKKAIVEIEGVNQNDFMAIYAGTIGIANGIDALLDVAEVLRARNRDDIKMVLIGRGNRKKYLMECAKVQNLSNCIFMDPVPKETVAQMIASAGVGLMVLANVPAFYYGTSPNKFFDYIASGIPVINNYPGWLAEMIIEQQSGFAVKHGDADQFADAMCSLADTPGLRRTMGENSLALSKKFLRAHLAQQFCDVIEEAANGK